jgi:hypothetical protein
MVDPFKKCELDFMGPIHPSSINNTYILVCTDNVTKWVEAKALQKATEKVVEDFFYGEIFDIFGVP